jgi:hypothetical protein
MGKEQKSMKSPRLAAIFITAVAASGLVTLAYNLSQIRLLDVPLFLTLVLISAAASRMKVKLPGITGNMSVNFPFLLLAIVELSLPEAALIAFVSTTVQSLPRDGKPLKMTQVLFNACTVMIASTLAYIVFHGLAWSKIAGGTLSAILAAGTFCLVNTMPVATVIALTEGVRPLRTWLDILHLSFPYYVTGTSIGSVLTMRFGCANWILPLAVLPVMILIHRSYRTFFRLQ